MGVVQGAFNRVIGTAAAAATLSGKLSDKKSGLNQKLNKPGVDAQMAAKARKVAQQKIKTIQSNKEISDKAKTRRIGKVLDEFVGGNK